MGQCYFMTIKFKGDFDEAAIVKKTIEFMKYRAENQDKWGRKVRFTAFPTEDMSIKQAIKKLIGDQDIGEMYDMKKDKRVPYGYVAGFDGSYGFGEVMENWFDYISPVAGDGTEFYLEPDDGYTEGIVINGKAQFTYHYE